MKASESEIVVHQAAVDGAAALAEEGFLSAAQGSFFVSRISEVVVLEPSGPEGVARLPEKVEQLVGKGLHNVIVSLGSAGDADNKALSTLSQVKEVLDRCVGSLRLCDVDPALAHKLDMLGMGLPVLVDRDAAVRDYREGLGEEKDEDQPDDWGWGSGDSASESARVAVAELLVQDSELPKLLKDVSQIVEKSQKKHVSLRLHFARQITSEDVNVLTSVRDFLAKRGGQLVLVSLQHEVLKWLKLLEFDSEFLIVENADDADAAHQAHASGRLPRVGAAPKAKPKPEPKPPKPKPAEAQLQVDPGDALAVTQSELGKVESDETDALTVTLRKELEKARAEAKVLETRVHQLEQEAHLAKQESAKAAQRASELEGAVKHSERRLKELEQGKAEAERRASKAESASGEVGGEVERLEGQVRALRKELDEARTEIEGQSQSSDEVLALQKDLESKDGRIGELRANQTDLEGRLSRVRQDWEGATREAASLRKQLEAAASGDDDVAALRRRCAALEDDKARILSEAEEEIRRLSGEREMLNDELASAGEMIERLGKELELS